MPATFAEARVLLLTTGPVEMLEAAAQRWLDLPATCCRSVTVP
jgi:glutamate racemase